ncbi:MAG: hypothetical protein KDB03_23160 [Planctomycetales bacterium]|nr:hypothetical protein [Planctomycetales bacterium]
MNSPDFSASYFHRQYAPLCLILYGFSAVSLVLVILIGDIQGIYIGGGVSLLLGSLGPAFHYLQIKDDGHKLSIQFGPLPLFQRPVYYAQLDSVRIDRTWLLDGWGIHYSLRGGWVWNIWGRDCVALNFKGGGVFCESARTKPKACILFYRIKLPILSHEDTSDYA